MLRFVEVAKKSEISENGAISVEVEGKRLALMNLKGEIYAIDDDCPPEGGPLSTGSRNLGPGQCMLCGRRWPVDPSRVKVSLTALRL